MPSYKGSYSSSARSAEWEPPSRDIGECAGTGPERPGDAKSSVGLEHDSIYIFNAANTLTPDRRADVRLGDALAAHRIVKKPPAIEQQRRLRIATIRSSLQCATESAMTSCSPIRMAKPTKDCATLMLPDRTLLVKVDPSATGDD
ncbi:hypothetical protein N2604_33750 [Bradyrhizobium sp. CB1015]|nr:hypothetical protein [Bradyrhizobium sp. CB1015]UWU91358.1 hypothetical protein N2604_33750 [Bradyrhizobium sp. CB1015]